MVNKSIVLRNFLSAAFDFSVAAAFVVVIVAGGGGGGSGAAAIDERPSIFV